MSSDEDFQRKLLETISRVERNTGFLGNLRLWLTVVNTLIFLCSFVLLVVNGWLTYSNHQQYQERAENFRMDIERIDDQIGVHDIYISNLRQEKKLREAIEEIQNE